ncbi:MAG: Y-family DNA polymerase [Caldisericia bacterium]|nr:Y-family DNA polymerase [Caldisericia bacterium]
MDFAVLVDCNSFYASCERVFNPSLNNKPVAVLSNNDGCVIACTKEAKKIGIKMGTPFFKCKKLMEENNGKFFSSNYTLYGDLSNRVMDVLVSYPAEHEIYSIDEAFLLFNNETIKSIFAIGRDIRYSVKRLTGVPVSVGIASTKTLAKIANHIAKKSKNGVYVFCSQKQVNKVMKITPVSEVWGIGRQYSKKLQKNNIYTAEDLCKMPDTWIRKLMTNRGLQTVWELRGYPCVPTTSDRVEKKGINTSRSFSHLVTDKHELYEALAYYTTLNAEKLRKQNSCTQMVCVYLSTNHFRDGPQYRAAHTISLPTATAETPLLIRAAYEAMDKIFKSGYSYKKTGCLFLGLIPEISNSNNLFFKTYYKSAEQNMMKVMDKVNEKYGRDTLRYASTGIKRSWTMNRKLLSPAYTTSWKHIKNVEFSEK